MVPEYLYRGDNDSEGTRSLRSTIDHFQLQTNLLNGGNGRVIFESPLLDLIDEHVGFGWSKTHFLSFSESETIAYQYGIHCESDEVENKMLDCTQHFDLDSTWDFAVIVLDTKTIKWDTIDKGVYVALYPPSLTKFMNLPYYRAIFINVSEVLSENAKYIESYKNSTRDSEWLILPATKILLNSNKVEYPGILDGGCFSEIKKYKFY